MYSKIDPRDIFSSKKAINNIGDSSILLSLLGTGFFENFNDNIYPYKMSTLFKEFIDLIGNLDDITKWEQH